MIVLLCGLSGCGKSIHAEKVAEKYGLKCIHASGIFRQLKEKKSAEIKAEEAEMNVGFWESEQGEELMQERLLSSDLDKAVDAKLLELIEQDNVVMDSWTMPWLSQKGIKIWLNVSDKERAKRLAGRDKMSEEKVMAEARQKEEQTKEIYKKLYGFDFGDLSVFHKIIESDNKSIDKVFKEITDFIDLQKD
jgi:cytidylate kinase